MNIIKVFYYSANQVDVCLFFREHLSLRQRSRTSRLTCPSRRGKCWSWPRRRPGRRKATELPTTPPSSPSLRGWWRKVRGDGTQASVHGILTWGVSLQFQVSLCFSIREAAALCSKTMISWLELYLLTAAKTSVCSRHKSINRSTVKGVWGVSNPNMTARYSWTVWP